MKDDNPAFAIFEAARSGGVKLTAENCRMIDRYKAGGLMRMEFQNEQEPITSQVFRLTKKGHEVLDGMAKGGGQ